MKQQNMPIIQMLEDFQKKNPLSFHVPGHKNGAILPNEVKTFYQHILKLDLTELPGLDDLHAPHGAIAEAEELASEFFQSDHTFFLVNGSTVGNLAMILAVCGYNDKVIVQRNCHKSIINGLELAGARPVFVAPEYDKRVYRFTNPAYSTIERAITEHPDVKAVILTYPDYFGRTYDIEALIRRLHDLDIPVLVDEAHGVHFSLGNPFPTSALALGADVVVHSAHKTAPAMTMASYLHINSTRVSKDAIAYRLQMLQSSSPSYPLMASLDIARHYLATQSNEMIRQIVEDAAKVKTLFQLGDKWEVIPSDDPLKITIQMNKGYSAQEAADLFEDQGIYPELTTGRQILFILGLAPFEEVERLKKVIKYVEESLKNTRNHATIEPVHIFTDNIQELALSYREMERLEQRLLRFEQAIGEIAAEPIVPYPPGIPLILKGEMVTDAHHQAIKQLTEQGVRIQQRKEGIRVFSRKPEGESQ